MDNQTINQTQRIKAKILGDGHIIGHSIDGCVFESKISEFTNYVMHEDRVNRLITVFCITLN